MTQQTIYTKKNGFVHSGTSNFQDDKYSPIYAYRNLVVTTLDEAVKDMFLYVPDIEAHVKQAKRECNKEKTELTPDESAAIYLYTMAKSFHNQLNDRLRSEDPVQIQPCLAFLKLFIIAVRKLPSLAITVWRGVSSNISSDFVKNPVQTWWTVNSCSRNLRVVEWFLGDLGTVFGIETMHGKDIAKYSAFPEEQEILLMPGTRVRLMGQPLTVVEKPCIIHLKEWGIIPEGKHVMLSYHPTNHAIVAEISRVLQDEHVPVRCNEYESTNNLHDSLANCVENAAIICCFLTPDYEASIECKLELQYAQKQSKIIIPCLLRDTNDWKPSAWLQSIISDPNCISFDDISQSSIYYKVMELIDRITYLSPPSQTLSLTANNLPSYLFELIRYEYLRNDQIKRLINPAKSVPIAESYINLAIVETKKQQEKEKQLRLAQNVDDIIGGFEEIYGAKTTIDIKNIFQTCKNQHKQVLVFGRAGIGKSTFCQYITYQWATSSYWPQYELLALIPLRNLTSDRYPLLPSGHTYSLIDLIKKEVYPYDLSENEEKLLKKHFDPKKTLWIMDGYDEIVQNLPGHLKHLFNERLLKTPHHLLTSRPYLNKLSYDVQMEITGFTDNNIEQYIEQFFDQMDCEVDDANIKSENLLNLLKSNQRIWGIVHIPVNLELICSIWGNEDWSETKDLTITTLYTLMVEWLCRRYLIAQNIRIENLSSDEVEQHCQKELTFLETLAFHAMEKNTIIIRPALLEQALKEAKVSFQENPHILNIGLLKSFSKQGTGTQVERSKDHYFVHLSFQEYFAARYLVNALKLSATEKITEFTKYQKYNQRYALVFPFASGLLRNVDVKTAAEIFWDALLRESVDLVGIRHLQLIISCMEEISDQRLLPEYEQVLDHIAYSIYYSFSHKSDFIQKQLLNSLQRASSVACHPIIINMIVNLLQNVHGNEKTRVLSFISRMKISNPPATLISSITSLVNNSNVEVSMYACLALGMIGEKAATNEVINIIMNMLGDESEDVKENTCFILEKMGEETVTNKVISKLVSALGFQNERIRKNACEALEMISEKAAVNEVATGLVNRILERRSWSVSINIGGPLWKMDLKSQEQMARGLNESELIKLCACFALGKMSEKVTTNELISKQIPIVLIDESEYVRMYACFTLGKMIKKAVTNEVISKLVSAFDDESELIRMYACKILGKMAEKAATNEVISKLVSALEDNSDDVRRRACEALGKMARKVVTNDVIRKLASIAVQDENRWVRKNAYEALGMMGEEAATNEVISKLMSVLEGKNEDNRAYVYEALGKMGEKAATNKVISKLVSALEDEKGWAQRYACKALGMMGEKVATSEVISKLVWALGNNDEWVSGNACEALTKLAEKAATNEVISQLMSALGNENKNLRLNACRALGKMSGKVATNNEVINKLLNIALTNKGEFTLMYACKALGKMGENAATNEVISGLLSVLDHKSIMVRINARKALERMGKKVATNEVIDKLLDLVCGEDISDRWNVIMTIENIFSSSVMVRKLGPENILYLCRSDYDLYFLRNVSDEELFNFFFTTGNRDWLSVITRFTLRQKTAVIITRDKVVVYGRQQPIELRIPSFELRQQLIEAFIDQTNELNLCFELTSNDGNRA